MKPLNESPRKISRRDLEEAVYRRLRSRCNRKTNPLSRECINSRDLSGLHDSRDDSYSSGKHKDIK